MIPPWEYDASDPYMFPSLQDEQRYLEDVTKNPKNYIIECVACGKEIDKLNAHILRTLYTGWHMTQECLEHMSNWVIEETQRRETTKWSGTT